MTIGFFMIHSQKKVVKEFLFTHVGGPKSHAFVYIARCDQIWTKPSPIGFFRTPPWPLDYKPGGCTKESSMTCSFTSTVVVMSSFFKVTFPNSFVLGKVRLIQANLIASFLRDIFDQEQSVNFFVSAGLKQI